MAFVQSNTFSGNNSNPTTVTFASTTTSGNTIIVLTTLQNAVTASGCTDSAGNTYTQRGTTQSWNSSNVYVYTAPVTTAAASTQVRIAASGTGWATNVIIMEVSQVTSFDAIAFGNPTAANPTTGPAVTTTATNDIVVGWFYANATQTWSAGSGYSNVTQISTSNGVAGSIASEYGVVAAAGATSPTINLSNSAGATVFAASIAFKSTAASPIVTPTSLALMGIGI